MTSGAPRRLPHLIGTTGPSVVVPARIAAILEAHAGLSALRVRTRGTDAEATDVLEALRFAALSWRENVVGSASSGTSVAPKAEPEPACKWMTTGKAADLIGISSRAIRKAIADGRLPAQEVGGRHRITREDLEHFRAARKERE